MRFSLLFALICLGVFLFWLVSRDQQAKKALRRFAKGIGIVAAIGLGLLAIRALPYLAALLPFLLPLLIRRYAQTMGPARSSPFARPFAQDAAAGRTPKTSRVATRFFEMELDHETGAMSGRVLQGRFAGRILDELERGELISLWHECRADAQSSAVYESYLQRVYPDWQDAANAGPDKDEQNDSTGGRMDRREALAILGLDDGAGEAEIRAAHRRLIQRLHPDQGGTDYLASRINRAKDFLLDGK